MRSVKTVHVISEHVEGQVGDVIVGGITAPTGATSGKTPEQSLLPRTRS